MFVDSEVSDITSRYPRLQVGSKLRCDADDLRPYSGFDPEIVAR
jgi:hypothetical protein